MTEFSPKERRTSFLKSKKKQKNKKNTQTKMSTQNSVPSKNTLYKWRWNKDTQIRGKLREFVTRRPALKEMQKGAF